MRGASEANLVMGAFDDALRAQEGPTCPHCGEQRGVEKISVGYLCAVRAKVFAVEGQGREASGGVKACNAILATSSTSSSGDP